MAEELDDDNSPDESSDDRAEAPAAAKSAPSSGLSSISNLDQFAQYKQQMAQAQAQAAQNSMGVNLARAGATAANALSGSQKSVDETPFNALEASANAPVQNIMDQQKAQLGAASLESKIGENASNANDSDSESSSSITARALFKKNYPDATAALGDSFDDMTKDDVVSALKDQQIKAKLDENSETAKMRNQVQLMGAQDRADKAAQLKNAGYEKTYTDENNALWSPGRKNPNVSTAMVGLTSSDKAMSIINRYKGNLDAMPQADYNTLKEEIGKIATGGIPGEHTVAGMSASTLSSRFSSALSSLGDKPVGATLGAFINNDAKYLGELHNINQSVIDDYQRNIHRGYSNRYGPEQNARFESDNSRLFNQQNAPTQGASSAPDLHASVAAEIQRRQAAKAQASVQSTIPNLGGAPQTNAQGVPSSLQPNPQGFAYGGMVGGLPSANFNASQAMHPPRPPHLNLHAPRGYSDGGEVKKPDNSAWIKNSNQSYASADPKQDAKVYTGYAGGGQIPGRAQVPGNSPKNDTIPIMASPGEYVVPRHIMQGPAGRVIRKMCEGGTV